MGGGEETSRELEVGGRRGTEIKTPDRQTDRHTHTHTHTEGEANRQTETEKKKEKDNSDRGREWEMD